MSITRGMRIVFCLVLVTATAGAQEKSPSIEEQLALLRQELAGARLQLDRTKEQMQELQAFLAEKELDKKFSEWQSLRETLAEERRQIKAERRQLEQLQDQMHRQTTLDAQERAEAEQAQKQAQADALKPNWSAQYMMGLIDKERQTIYVDSTRGSVLVDQYPSIDRANIKVRGTFVNKSIAPWRYTFVIRAAGEPDTGGQRVVAGEWRYQTPVMGPGDLHAFEVTVPVSDVRHVEVVQVGNVTADRPSDPSPPEPRQPGVEP